MMLVLWCALIFFLSSQSQLPGPEDQLADFLFKKIAHMTVYAVMYLLAFRAFELKNLHRRYLFAFVFCVLYAISDEFHQMFVPGRTPALRDIGFDIVGMTLMFLKIRGWHVFSSWKK